MQDGSLTSDLIKIAKEKLASGEVQSVIGWKKVFLTMMLRLPLSKAQKNLKEILSTTKIAGRTFQSI